MSSKDFRKVASAVLYIKFKDNQLRTFYSRDIEKQPGNLHYWSEHLLKLATVKWKDKFLSYAIYRCANGAKVGDPIFKSHE